MAKLVINAQKLGSPEEAEKIGLLCLAMQEDKTVNFLYDGKIRVVEAHAVGHTDKGAVFRGYQVAGVASRPLPQWTLFSLDKVEALTLGKEASEAPREGYAQGDRQMTGGVICELAL